MSLILYGLPLSPFYRKVEMVLREKGLPFEASPVNIRPMPDWFKAIRPAHRIPVLRDTDVGEKGIAGTIPDSSAICAYLERKHPAPALYLKEPYPLGRALWIEWPPGRAWPPIGPPAERSSGSPTTSLDPS